MCLTIKGSKTRDIARQAAKPLIAKKNIVVYKSFYYKWRGEHILESPFQGHRYARKSLHKVKKLGIIIMNWASCDWRVEVNEGLHSWTTRQRAKNCDGNTIVRCTIPKGAKYLKSKNGDIVSTHLYIGTTRKKIILEGQ